MLESKDILFYVLAFCALVLTGFFAWFLYYLVQIFRRFNDTVQALHDLVTGVKEKLDRLDELLRTLQDKLSSSATYLALLAKAGKDLFEHFKQKRSSRRKT